TGDKMELAEIRWHPTRGTIRPFQKKWSPAARLAAQRYCWTVGAGAVCAAPCLGGTGARAGFLAAGFGGVAAVGASAAAGAAAGGGASSAGSTVSFCTCFSLARSLA